MHAYANHSHGSWRWSASCEMIILRIQKMNGGHPEVDRERLAHMQKRGASSDFVDVGPAFRGLLFWPLRACLSSS